MSDWSIFPNGTSFMMWLDQNCDRCRKGDLSKLAKDGSNPLCEIETEISLSSVLDGKLRPEKRETIGPRLKWDGHTYLKHDCPEFEPL
jgi:hypothetical protein